MGYTTTKRANGQAEFARLATSAPAWWEGLRGEGKAGLLKAGAGVEAWQRAAGLDWGVQRATVRYATKRGQESDFASWDNWQILMRSDNKHPLGIVSKDYKVVSPTMVLEFFRDLTERDDFHLDVAGSMFDGRILWAQATMGEQATVLDRHDKLKGRVMLTTSLDGSRQTTACFPVTRAVCENTLNAALAEGGRSVKVNHRSVFDATRVKLDLGVGREAFAKFTAQAKQLAQVTLDPAVAVAMTMQVLEPKLAAVEANKLSREQAEELTKATVETKAFKSLMALFQGGRAKGSELNGVKGTAWGWLNAFTEYVDHYRPASSPDHRGFNSTIGVGAALKERAEEAALAILA